MYREKECAENEGASGCSSSADAELSDKTLLGLHSSTTLLGLHSSRMQSQSKGGGGYWGKWELYFYA